MTTTRAATVEEQQAVSEHVAQRCSPSQLLAAGIADFQRDLAATDGWAHKSGVPDLRLGALTLRLVARIAAARRNDPAMQYQLCDTTALDDFIEALEEDANRVLGITASGPG